MPYVTIRYTKYLYFLSLQDDGVYGEYTTYMQKYWTCPKCSEKLLVTLVEKLQHEQQCSIDTERQLQGKITNACKVGWNRSLIFKDFQ